MRALLRPMRVSDWWEDKLAPILGTGYATACFAGAPLLDVAGGLALVLFALIPGAVYVGLLNDLTDREDDRAAGRPDPLAGRSLRVWWAMVAGAVAIGAAFALLAWRTQLDCLILYVTPWVAFALYSVPPLRLKARGVAGLVADAVGANLCPHLLIAAAVLAADGRGLDGSWAAVVGTWALASGLRGALCHQVADAAGDERSGVQTFARAHPDLARRLGAYVVFPVEVLSFVVLLVVAGAVAAIVLIPAYMLVQAGRVQRWRYSLFVVGPPGDPPYRIVMHDFYAALYPLGGLVTAVVRHPADALILVVHLALFGRTLMAILGDVYRFVKFSRLWPVAR